MRKPNLKTRELLNLNGELGLEIKGSNDAGRS